MIYLDNSATSYPKPKEVLSSMTDGLTKYGANPGRSGHSFSLASAMKVFGVREKLCNFVGCDKPEHIILTSGCTEALNLAILGSVKEGGHVVLTANEHNSVSRPLFELQKQGKIEISVAEPKSEDCLTLEDILPFVKENTYLICVNQVSNVDGMVANISKIGDFCFEKNIMLLVDSAQGLGHIKVDMVKQHISMLAIAGHKGLYGPQGIGALAFTGNVKLKPIKFGGTGTDSSSNFQPNEPPECFESGTIATPNVIGLGAGLDFVIKNFDAINKKIDDLTTYLNYELRNTQNVIVYTHPNNAYGVLAFNVANLDSTEVSEILDKKFHIMVRSGLQCAPLKHKSLGTIEQGVVRISLSFFNSFNDISSVIKAIKEIANY